MMHKRLLRGIFLVSLFFLVGILLASGGIADDVDVISESVADDLPDSCELFKDALTVAWHKGCGDEDYDDRVDVASTSEPVADCYINHWDLFLFAANAYNETWCIEKIGEPGQVCEDSDGGLNYYVEGTVNGLEAPGIWDIWSDYCGTAGEEAGKLVEYICKVDNYGQKVIYECPGICEDGACVCSDSDGGLNYYVKGLVIARAGDEEVWDSCKDSSVLYEGTCDEQGGKVYEFTCQNGCADGICIFGNDLDEGECYDSDDGQDYYVKGTTYDHGETYNSYDSCDGGVLIEYYCDFDATRNVYYREEVSYTCPNGCEEGACYSEPDFEMEDIELTPSPKDFNSGDTVKITPEFEHRGIEFNTHFFIRTTTYNEEGEEVEGCGTLATYQEGGFINIECDIELYEEGLYTFVTEIDSENAVIESNESNNIIEKRVFMGRLKPQNKPEALPEEILDEEALINLCYGCKLANKCYPFGYRKEGKFCSDEGGFVLQLEADGTCDNNFECESNVCVDGTCVSGSLLQKIIEWFRTLFS